MTSFVKSSDGLDIAYEVAGEGTPVVLIHGFASDRMQNWKTPGWYACLNEAGCRVVALDCRGHGASEKPHDSARYGHERMADDVLAVMRAASIKRAHVMGYSMGGMIAMQLLMHHAGAIDRLVIGGVGGSYLAEPDSPDSTMANPALRAKIVAALLETDETKITDPMALGFRKFADQAGKDRRALAACMGAERHIFSRGELSRSTRPVLVVCGEKDDRTGTAEELAVAFAEGRGVTVPGRDHMTTVGDKVYKRSVLEFLAD